jgi:hypothetical protein
MREQAGRGSSEQEQASGRWRAPGTAGQSVPDGVGEHKYARAVIVADITQAKLASECLVWRTERSSREKREEKKRLRTRVEHFSVAFGSGATHSRSLGCLLDRMLLTHVFVVLLYVYKARRILRVP